ncbi:MAG: hypothetical protein KDD66_08155 [Bdellovibrionales bacterium]|nr:hypothetical protein [Bdellovibrionales bacterium]
MKQAFAALFFAVCFLQFSQQPVFAYCASDYGMARFPALVPSLGKYACPSSENQASGNILISQEYNFDGLTIKSFMNQYRSKLESKGWKIGGIRNAPTLHAILATHSGQGLTIEVSASEMTEGKDLIDVKKIDPKTFDPGKFNVLTFDPNATKFRGKVVLKQK